MITKTQRTKQSWYFSRALITQNRLLSILMAALLGSTACNPFGLTRRSWTEDVDLGDGQIIQVNRTIEFRESNSWSGDSYSAVENKAVIAFTGELTTLPHWSQPLMALVMYQDKLSREWVVVATTTSSEVLRQLGNPCPPYWEYRLSANGWRETPVSETSIGRRANLLHRYQSKFSYKHITVEIRQSMQPITRPLDSMNAVEKSYHWILSEREAECRT